MSDKDNLKNKIKRPTAAGQFFNQYEDRSKEEEEKVANIENKATNDEEYFKHLAQGKKPSKETKKSNKVFTSFYMDADLAKVIENKIVKNGKKGDKSKFINLALRRLLEEYDAFK
ncbi:hypothetical protein [Priestia endophytica]|uniref:hypothetical protein n=1 Tax=Priestia endophytica TaxID=135735 RepID=UPI003D26CB8F